MPQPIRGDLFNLPAYTESLQRSSSACDASGWSRVSHAGLATALWEKQHSWGEFVFDQNFAQAYTDAGLNYYPKLVCAIPFTPVPGPRLGADPQRAAAALRTRCEEHAYSGAHVLFLPHHEAQALEDANWLLREDLRYVWHNRSYTDFAHFLSELRSKRRKTIRTERRQVTGYGFDIRWQAAHSIEESEWSHIYALYASTYHMRGQAPYLSPDCLQGWGRGLAQQMQFCLARKDGKIQAMAFFFDDGQHLYGRHWGAARDWPGLHFELCYYRAMEYCIDKGLNFFDAGVQGRHRLQRGFEPEISCSIHHFRDARFQAAIAGYLQQERALIQEQFTQFQEQTAYRENTDGEAS